MTEGVVHRELTFCLGYCSSVTVSEEGLVEDTVVSVVYQKLP